ncbi:hypothetical protein [Kineococcus sp. SYSU DK003]|uniref:hypothetical protein n=1 Tax=Kineococcus sp. SYSU DK003 TaxID=3383124 RepID=UPI003D7D5440
MRLGVTTEELSAAAGVLREDSSSTGGQESGLTEASGSVATWVPGRSARVAQAFFDALADAARQAGDGLQELGNRLGAAAGEYDGVEQRLLREP